MKIILHWEPCEHTSCSAKKCCNCRKYDLFQTFNFMTEEEWRNVRGKLSEIASFSTMYDYCVTCDENENKDEPCKVIVKTHDINSYFLIESKLRAYNKISFLL